MCSYYFIPYLSNRKTLKMCNVRYVIPSKKGSNEPDPSK